MEDYVEFSSLELQEPFKHEMCWWTKDSNTTAINLMGYTEKFEADEEVYIGEW